MSHAARLLVLCGSFLSCYVTASFADQPTITINSAVYYDVKSFSGPHCDFTKKFACTPDTRRCDVLKIENGSTCGDPANGGNKEARIVYTCSWPGVSQALAPFFRPVKKTIVGLEHTDGQPSCFGEAPLPVHAETITIKETHYGDLGTNRTCRFDDEARARCDGATSCSFESHMNTKSLNFLCGDPASGSTSKRATVRFTCTNSNLPSGLTTPLHEVTTNDKFGTLNIACPAKDWLLK